MTRAELARAKKRTHTRWGHRLHRVHAEHQSSRLQLDHPLPMTWRAEGTVAELGLKELVAHRFAVCWNVLEGLPTEALERGILRELCDAIDDGDLARAQRALAEVRKSFDTTNGRLNDCQSCPGGLE